MTRAKVFFLVMILSAIVLPGCGLAAEHSDVAYADPTEQINSAEADQENLQKQIVDFGLEVEPPQTNGHIETERKFLLDINLLPDDMADRSDIYFFEQTYISESPEIRVRRINDAYFFFTLKTPMDDKGLSRQEIDFQISAQEYENLITKQIGSTITKTRYQFYEGGIYMAVDVYSGSLQGLAVAEVEFESVEASEKFVPFDWFGDDVTSDKRYKNINLALHGMPIP